MQKITLDDAFKPVTNYPHLMLHVSEGGYLVRHRLEQSPQGKIGTREVHLSDLGHFPLPEEDIPQLTQELQIGKNLLKVPEILQRSNIPLFYSAGERYPVYIPRVSVAICRYFAAMWGAEGDDIVSLTNGFLIIDSFVGGRE